MRFLIVRFVLENDGIPMNPFMAFDYYLADTVDRDIIRNANNNLVAMAEELWVFGDISNGILAEIKQFQKLRRKIRFFKIENDKDFVEIRGRETKMEEDVKTFKHLMENI